MFPTMDDLQQRITELEAANAALMQEHADRVAEQPAATQNRYEALLRELRESEHKYRTLFERMAQGVVYQDASGLITSANAAAEQLLGLSLAQMTGMSSMDPHWHAISEEGSAIPGEMHPAMISLRTGRECSAVMGIYNSRRNSYRWINVSARPEYRPGEDTPYQVFTTFDDITELRKALTDLEEANSRLGEHVAQRTREISELSTLHRAVLSAVPDVLFRVDRDGRFIAPHLGDPAASFVPVEQYLGRTIHEILPPAITAQAMEALETAFRSRDVVAFEYALEMREGVRHFENRTVAVSDNEALAIVRDITDKQNAVEALRWNESLLSMMASSSPLAFLVVDNRSDDILYFNHRFCEIWNIGHLEEGMRAGVLKNSDIIPDCTRVLKDAPSVDATSAPLQQVDNRAVIEDEIPFTDGRVIRRFSTQIRDDNDGYLGRLYIFEDITERKQTEQLLRMQSAALESSALPIVITDTAGRVQWANGSYLTNAGYTREEVIGKTSGELISSGLHPASLYEEMWARILAGKVWHGELVNRRKDGSLHPEDVTITPVFDHQGQLSNFIAVSSDISQRKLVEENLRATLAKERELNDLKSRFVSMASHEFRTPLASILMSCETLLAYGDRFDSTQTAAKLQNIKTQVEHLADVVTKVMHVSRIQEGRVTLEPQQVDLPALCRSTIHAVEAQHASTGAVMFETEFNELVMTLDVRLMQQVLTNLLTNAIKYTPAGPRIRVALARDNDCIVLRVIDNGIGIPPQDRKYLFQPFYRASNTKKVHGDGLGLYIVKEAVILHGGTIGFTSILDEGSSFEVRLPADRIVHAE